MIPKKDAEILVDYIATKTDYRTVADFIKDILYKYINTHKKKMKEKVDNTNSSLQEEDNQDENVVKSQVDYSSGLQFSG